MFVTNNSPEHIVRRAAGTLHLEYPELDALVQALARRNTELALQLQKSMAEVFELKEQVG